VDCSAGKTIGKYFEQEIKNGPKNIDKNREVEVKCVECVRGRLEMDIKSGNNLTRKMVSTHR
jgi:hypothetical protein